MARKAKIGLSVVGIFLMILGGMVVKRLTEKRHAKSPASLEVSAASTEDHATPALLARAEREANEHGWAKRQRGIPLNDAPRVAAVAPASFEESPDENAAADRTLGSGTQPSDMPLGADEPAPISGDPNWANLDSPPTPGDAPPVADEPGDNFADPRASESIAPQTLHPRRPAVEQAEGIPTSGASLDDAQNQDMYEPRRSPELDRRTGPREFAGHSALPASTETGKYTVQPNDSYWTISERVYGSGGYFKAIHEHNRSRFPKANNLQVGDVLDMPPAPSLEKRYPDLCPKPRRVPAVRQTLQAASTRHRAGERVYVVAEGDTLFDVARYELGRAARWVEIYELNRDVLGEEFDYLRPGTELVMPNDRRESEAVTRKAEPGYQR